MSEMKRALKDSVFTLMFGQPEYAVQLYRALHPEDTEVTAEECKVVTLESILTVGQYNDLGLQVRDRLLLLVEAQSTFSVNISLRMLMYVAATYKEYVEEQKLDLYGSRPVRIPRPELYVIYTGTRREVPDVLRLSDLYEGEGGLDLQARVCRYRGAGDILDQYVRFCEIADENRRRHGRTRRAVEEILRQCGEENVLASFLASRRKEVCDIMVTLFDQEKVMEIWKYNTAREAKEEGMQQGMQQGMRQGMRQGMQQGLEEGIRAMVSTLQEMSVDRDLTAQKVAKQFGLSMQSALEKVSKYWKG